MFGNTLILAATVGLVAALPQNIDFAAVNALPAVAVQGPPLSGQSQVPSYKTKAAASSAAAIATADPIASTPSDSKRRAIKARQACAPQPTGAGPATTPDTADDFLANPVYDNTAQSAPIPDGYSLAFSDLQGSSQQNGYMGFYSLNSYDPYQCQEYCDAAQGCDAFNLYFERDPSVDPGDACPDPASTVNIRCVLWGLPVSADTATNEGQWRDQFEVVITGSNGYNKNAPPAGQSGFTGPDELGGAINAPLTPQGYNTYIGMNIFSGPYDPSQCAAACQSTTAYDRQHLADSNGYYYACNFFNSYVLSENGNPLGTYCSYYNQTWDRSYATNDGQYDGQGNRYTVSQSYSYTLATLDCGNINTC